jgi:hypothetical protein
MTAKGEIRANSKLEYQYQPKTHFRIMLAEGQYTVMQRAASALEAGALLVIDKRRARPVFQGVRISKSGAAWAK